MFSLYREYVAQLMEYGKKFIIIGNMNCLTYKEFFPLIKNDIVWPGVNEKGGTRKGNSLCFGVPNSSELVQVSAWWFTNLDHKKRHEPLTLWRKYADDPKKYPKYDNYEAINVDKTDDIPVDYDGVMGVPISFLDKYCPEQFEIVALGNGRENFTPTKDYINPIMIKKGKQSNGNALNRVLAYKVDVIPTKDCYYQADNAKGMLFAPYARILIRRRKL